MSAGRVCTRIYDEKPVCCDLGWRGIGVCLATLPVGTYEPVGGLIFFVAFTYCLRHWVMRKYNVEEEKVCPCISCRTPFLEFLYYGLSYPCSLFQMYVSLKEWDDEAKPHATMNANVEKGATQPSVVALQPIQ